MFHKERVGDIEVIYPDDDMKDLIKDIIKQNSTILSMNKSIVDSVTSSPIFIREENTNEI